MNVPIERIRIACDMLTADQVQDVQTKAQLDMFRSRDVQFEVGLFYDTDFVADLTNLTSMTLQVKRNDERKGIALMSQTKVLADMNGSLTEADWDAETSQHVLFSFTAAEAALPMKDGVIQQDFYVVISAILTTGKVRTVLEGTLKVIDDGRNDLTSVVAAGAYSYIYVGGADDASGTNFTADQTAIASKAYWAILLTNTVIASPGASDFAGLWRVNSTALMQPASGTGSPEGVVSRAPGVIYQDTATGDLYRKDSGTSNTNWVRFFIGT